MALIHRSIEATGSSAPWWSWPGSMAWGATRGGATGSARSWRRPLKGKGGWGVGNGEGMGWEWGGNGEGMGWEWGGLLGLGGEIVGFSASPTFVSLKWFVGNGTTAETSQLACLRLNKQHAPTMAKVVQPARLPIWSDFGCLLRARRTTRSTRLCLPV